MSHDGSPVDIDRSVVKRIVELLTIFYPHAVPETGHNCGPVYVSVVLVRNSVLLYGSSKTRVENQERGEVRVRSGGSRRLFVASTTARVPERVKGGLRLARRLQRLVAYGLFSGGTCATCSGAPKRETWVALGLPRGLPTRMESEPCTSSI